MAARKINNRFNCVECGGIISDRTLWVDNGGFLCRHCAMLSRFKRMKGEGIRTGRRSLELGHKGR